MKPMFRVFSFTLLSSTLLFSSCVKDLYDPEVIAEKNPDAEIPVGFKFTTTKNVNLTVNVNDEYNGEKFYMVEVYNQNPLASNSKSKLLSAGVATGRAPFVEDIVVSQSDSVLYVKQTDLSCSPLKFTVMIDITGLFSILNESLFYKRLYIFFLNECGKCFKNNFNIHKKRKFICITDVQHFSFLRRQLSCFSTFFHLP